jgi:hypothetical protein
MLGRDELVTRFDENVPYLFQRDLTKMVLECYKGADSAKNTFGLQKPVSDWLTPLCRHAFIQSHAFELAHNYSLEPEYRRTKDGNNYYLAIKAGPFVVTLSKTNHPEKLPRDADFRTQNSAVNYSLFVDEGNESDPIYAILTNVPHGREPYPAFLQFIFPDTKYDLILHRIDLLERFSLQLGEGSTLETPAVNPQPKLKKRAHKDGEAQA